MLRFLLYDAEAPVDVDVQWEVVATMCRAMPFGHRSDRSSYLIWCVRVCSAGLAGALQVLVVVQFVLGA